MMVDSNGDGLPTPKDVELRRELDRLRADHVRLINEKAALLARLMIPDAKRKGAWRVVDRLGDSSASYRSFPDRAAAERFLLGYDDA